MKILINLEDGKIEGIYTSGLNMAEIEFITSSPESDDYEKNKMLINHSLYRNVNDVNCNKLGFPADFCERQHIKNTERIQAYIDKWNIPFLNEKCYLLIQNQAESTHGQTGQKYLAAYIDGYLTAQGQLSRYVFDMYRSNDADSRKNGAHVYKQLSVLRKIYDLHYNELCRTLNDLILFDDKKSN